MKENKKNALLAASVAGLLSMAGVALTQQPSAHAGADGMEKCYGINACSGNGACGSKKHGHACHGQNSCEGKAWLYIPEGTCTKIKGGRLSE